MPASSSGKYFHYMLSGADGSGRSYTTIHVSDRPLRESDLDKVFISLLPEGEMYVGILLGVTCDDQQVIDKATEDLQSFLRGDTAIKGLLDLYFSAIFSCGFEIGQEKAKEENPDLDDPTVEDDSDSGSGHDPSQNNGPAN